MRAGAYVKIEAFRRNFGTRGRSWQALLLAALKHDPVWVAIEKENPDVSNKAFNLGHSPHRAAIRVFTPSASVQSCTRWIPDV
jgi:hypothetical protein